MRIDHTVTNQISKGTRLRLDLTKGDYQLGGMCSLAYFSCLPLANGALDFLLQPFFLLSLQVHTRLTSSFGFCALPYFSLACVHGLTSRHRRE